MLKKEFRIVSNKDFQRIYQKGKFFTNKDFVVKFLPNRFSFPRVGIVVSKKKVKKAVERNKLKRQLREVIRSEFSNLKEGFDIVVILRNNIYGFKFEELRKSLILLLKEAGLRR